MALTAAWVPTGTNVGVSIAPCGVVRRAVRALVVLSFDFSLKNGGITCFNDRLFIIIAESFS